MRGVEAGNFSKHRGQPGSDCHEPVSSLPVCVQGWTSRRPQTLSLSAAGCPGPSWKDKPDPMGSQTLPMCPGMAHLCLDEGRDQSASPEWTLVQATWAF